MKRVKKCWSEHPILTILFLVILVAVVVSIITAISKAAAAKKDDELLDDEWDLDDEDEDVYFCPSEDNLVEGN